MLMVIFGAGASYDSAAAYRLPSPQGGAQNFGVPAQAPDDGGPWRPPLANDLFLDRHHAFGEFIQKYGKLAHILTYLRELPAGKSVEEVLESLLAEGKDYPEGPRELASIRYYLCELFTEVTAKWSAQTNGVTNYAVLLREILRFNRSSEPVCLVTFNYDMLLDRALYTFGFKQQTPDLHLDSHPVFKLFKLHGSVWWARIVDAPTETRMAPQQLIEVAETLKFTDEFVLANPTDPSQIFNFGRPIFPAIAIPTQTKTEETFECPPSHRAKLAELLKSVTKVLIIGWRAREAHFTRLLGSHLPQLQHVSVIGHNSDDADQTLRYFMIAIGQIEVSAVTTYLCSGGFTDFIVNRRGLEFFSSIELKSMQWFPQGPKVIMGRMIEFLRSLISPKEMNRRKGGAASNANE